MRRNSRRLLVSLVLVMVLAAGSIVPTYAASTKTVYVLTKVTMDDQGSKTTLNQYKYNNNGLLRSSTATGSKREYKYDRKNRIIRYRKSFNEWATFDYTYNKKGRISKATGDYYLMANNKFAYDGNDAKYTYNKKGLVTKEVVTGLFGGKKNKTYTNTYKYNSKKQMIKAKIRTPGPKGTYNFKYDSEGNLASIIGPGKSKTVFTNAYKNGLLVKRKIEVYNPGYSRPDVYTYTFKYKKVSVPGSVKSKVDAQQWLIRNQQFTILNINFALPITDYDGM